MGGKSSKLETDVVRFKESKVGTKECDEALNALVERAENATDDERVLMVKSGVMDKWVQVVNQGTKTKGFSQAVIGLPFHLSRADGTQRLLYKTPKVVDIALDAAETGAKDGIKERGLTLLANLAVAEENKVDLFTPEVVTVVLNAAENGATDGIKVAGLDVLRKLSSPQRNKVPLFATILSRVTDATSNEAKQAGLHLLATLTDIDTRNKLALFDTPGVVDVALEAAHNGATNGIKEQGLAVLKNLAVAEENKVALFAQHNLVSVALRAADSGATNDIKEKGLAVLANLAVAEENKVALFTQQNLVYVALRAADTGATNETKEVGLKVLANLAVAEANQVSLFTQQNLVYVALRAADTGATNEIKEVGLKVLANLAVAEANQVSLFTQQNLVSVALRAAQDGATDGIKEAGLAVLANLALAEENKVPLFTQQNLVNVTLGAAQDGATNEIKEVGLKVLWGLSVAKENKAALFEEPRLVEVALGATENGDTDEIKMAGLHVLQNLTMNNMVADALIFSTDFVQSILRLVNIRTPLASLAVGILHNLSCSSSVETLDSPDVISALTSRLGDVNPKTSLRAIMALGNIIGTNKERSTMLRSNKNLFGVKYVLNQALETQGVSWPVYMPLLSLRSLSLVDTNRTYFVEAGLCPLLIRSLQVSLNTDDFRSTECAISTLQQFCFDAETPLRHRAQLILLFPQIFAKTTESWSNAKRDVAYLDFQLTNWAAVVVPVASSQKVMVSFAWANEDVGREVDEFLTSWGFRIWRNKHDMRGDIVNAMQHAVLESETVVVIVSEAYYKSANCHVECLFAHTKNKRIVPVLAEAGYSYLENWIGLLLPGVHYYDVSSPANFEMILSQMVHDELRGGF